MKNLVQKAYHSKPFAAFFHTMLYCLQRELTGCKTVLDLGCGPASPLQYCSGLEGTVGVEPFGPYFERATRSRTHTQLIQKRIQELEFEPNSFDAVVMIEVLEHLSEADALEMLRLAQRWARRKIIVTSPNGFVPQAAIDGNPLQEHLSGWSYSRMRSMGFVSRGLAGLKILRQEVHSNTMGDDLLVSIRWRPRAFWFVIATLSQIITYYCPQLAFGLFSVKAVGSPKMPSAQPLEVTAR